MIIVLRAKVGFSGFFTAPIIAYVDIHTENSKLISVIWKNKIPLFLVEDDILLDSIADFHKTYELYTIKDLKDRIEKDKPEFKEEY